MKKVLIFIFPYAFKFNDYKKFELDLIEKTTKVFVLELLDYLHPNFIKTYPKRVKKNNIINIKNRNQINKFLKKINTNYNLNDVYVINYVTNINLRSLLINNLVCKNIHNNIKIEAPGVKTYIFDKKKFNIFDYFREKVAQNNKILYFNFKLKILHYVQILFFKNIKYNYLLIAGNYFKKKFINKNPYKTRIIDFNSWDYSKTLKPSKKYNNFFKNYIVFLDVPNPNYFNENNLYGIKNSLDFNDWSDQLNNYFSFLQKKLKKEIVICPHPLTPADENYKKKFSKYKIIENQTMELIKYSDLVVNVGSTALSYAVVFRKPIVLIYNQNIKETGLSYKTIQNLSVELNCKLLNIEIEDYKNIDYSRIYSFDKKKYEIYTQEYLSCANIKKTNSEIISKLINKNENLQ